MPPQRVDGLRPLLRQKVARPEQHPLRLLLRALHRHEPHPRPRRRLADGLRVRRVVLLPLHERLHIRRRDDADLEPHRQQLPAPVVGASAGLHRHRAGPALRYLLKEPIPRHLLSERRRPVLAGPVELEAPLAKIDPDHANLLHCGCPFLMWRVGSAIMAFSDAAGRGVHSIALRASMDDFALPFVRFPGRRASLSDAARASGPGGSGTWVLQAPPDRAHGMGGADAGRDREAACDVRLPCRGRRPGMESRIDDLRRENHGQAVIRIRHWRINAPRPTAIQSGGDPSNPFASGRRTGAH